MGRNSTGALTTAGIIRLELKHLLKTGYIQRGKAMTGGGLSWIINGEHKAGDITIDSFYTDEEKYIRLRYTITREPYDYKIYLKSKPSNLGKGEVLYFICPVSFKLCRVLYLAYNSTVFKSREAYVNRIYYPLQISSKLGVYLDRVNSLEKKIEEAEKGRSSYSYNGRITRRRERINTMEEARGQADYLSMTIGMPKRLRALIFP